MKKNNEEYVREWLRFAKDNLIMAKRAMKKVDDSGENEYTPYHSVCFMCQGAAEKYFKAYLIWSDWVLEKTHDLTKLAEYCIDYDREFEKLLLDCEILNEYISEGRYPGDLPWESVGEDEANEAIESANKIANLVLAKLEYEFQIN